ncbi:arginine--tRNA ligase (plasmid) [Roseibium aggregatum]|uniref:arginine--tRNA ligase n=1 Tax=Roseibium aggregatum TaxID=187304 RepID=UPI001E2D0826|nr:arginine--tRNA ligase [Roseibium aggregatum]UES60178.1 arginine--tRNA ligase [Roseibium aggregatum]
MQPLLHQVNQVLIEAFQKLQFPLSYAQASWSDRPDLGDFQCNAAMHLAKILRQPPAQIAAIIVDELRERPEFYSVSIAKPGFINLKIGIDTLLAFSKAQVHDPLVGMQKRTGKVIVDFGGPNVAKPLHVGHLRSLVIGESLRRILVEAGYEVLSDVHLGDWGLQMGILISELKHRYPDLPYFQQTEGLEDTDLPVSIDELQLLYPQGTVAAKADSNRMLEARQITAELQNRHKGYYALWLKLREISINNQRLDFQRLHAHFDLWLGESDSQTFIPELIEIFRNKNLIRESDGALIVDVADVNDSYDIPPLILSKSDGSALYSTTDLATIISRIRQFDPNWIIYVVDQRQSLHFTQVFRAAKKAGIAKDAILTHAGFGTVNGKDGRPYKTRDGGVALLSTLLDEAVQKAEERIPLKQTAEVVGIGALKFADLDSVRTLGYVFDAERLVSLEGRTGPYIQYACVRIKSILGRAEWKNETQSFSNNLVSIEFELLLECSRFAEIFDRSVETLSPNELTQYLFTLAKKFSRFYKECPIVNSTSTSTRNSRLQICSLIYQILSKGLYLLGIEVPKKM